MNKKKRWLRRLELTAFFLVAALLLIWLQQQLKHVYRNVGSMAEREEQEEELTEAWSLLQPGEIFLTVGRGGESGYGRLSRSDVNFSDVFVHNMRFLQSCLQKGEGVRETEENFPWDRPACVFVYDLILETDLLQPAAGERELDAGLSGEEIWLFPSTAFDETAQVWIVNWAEGVFWKFEQASYYAEENREFLQLLQKQLKTIRKEWRCLKESFPDSFSKNGFVLRSERNIGVETSCLQVPFLEPDGLIREEADSFAAGMFEYPDSMQCLQVSEKQALYTNGAVTLSLRSTGEIRYTEALVHDGVTTDAGRDYQAALIFIREKLSSCLPEEIECRLSGFRREEGTRCFQFDYYWNSIKICMEDWLPEGLPAPAEITVEGGRVRSARFLPLEKAENERVFQVLETSWTAALISSPDGSRLMVPEPCLLAGENGYLGLVWRAERP